MRFAILLTFRSKSRSDSKENLWHLVRKQTKPDRSHLRMKRHIVRDESGARRSQFFPAPNQQAGIYPNDYLAIGDYALTRDNVDAKINYIPTEKLQIFGRYSFSPTLVFDPPSLGAAGGDATNGGQPGTAPGRIQSTGIGGTRTITPNVVVDGVFGYTRLRLSAKNVDIDKNCGLDVLKIPGTNGTDPLQGGYPRFTFNTFSSVGNPNHGSIKALNGYTEITSASGKRQARFAAKITF